MNSPTVLSCYAGAYGPTIRLDIQTLEDLLVIRKLFAELASEEHITQDLCRLLTCKVDSVQSITVQAVTARTAKALKLSGHGPQGPAFTWTNTRDEWLECLYKVDGLILAKSPGHQYLTSEGLDDALFELCFME